MKQKLLFIVFLMSFTFINAQSYEKDGLWYRVIGGTTNMNVSQNFVTYLEGEITILSNIDLNGVNYTVTEIASGAFKRMEGITSIVIPESITSIGDEAFLECEGITSIVIPDGVTIIEEYAFYECQKLESISLPKNITSIGEAAFANCKGLTSIDIPENVTSIGDSAFADCTGLTSIDIPENVTSIGESAFSYCSSLTSVKVNWATPLVIEAKVFTAVTLSNVSLSVPVGSESLYEQYAVWKDFGSILNTENFNSNIEVGLYPNPVKTKLSIILKEDLELKNIKIYNSLGQFVKSSKTLTTDTSNLSKGIYMIEISTNKGQAIKKFIVE